MPETEILRRGQLIIRLTTHSPARIEANVYDTELGFVGWALKSTVDQAIETARARLRYTAKHVPGNHIDEPPWWALEGSTA